MKKKLLVIVLFCILIDQISKILIINNLEVNTGFNIIKSFFSIIYVRNTGAAWGFFSSGTMILAFLSMTFLFLAIKYVFEMKSISKLSVISFGMLIGGITGNLIDRLVRGFVIDFFSFDLFGYNFPIFNLADSFIVISIILIVIESFVKEGKKDVSR